MEDLGRNQINSQAIELHSVLLINTKTTGEKSCQLEGGAQAHHDRCDCKQMATVSFIRE